MRYRASRSPNKNIVRYNEEILAVLTRTPKICGLCWKEWNGKRGCQGGPARVNARGRGGTTSSRETTPTSKPRERPLIAPQLTHLCSL